MTEDEYNASLDKAQECVGRFLWHWALMEAEIRQAIGAALGTQPIQTRILVVNIQLRDKIHILKTLASIQMLAPDAERLVDVLDQVATLSGARNMMAHDVFGPTDDGKGILFLTAKARGELKFPEIAWSHEQFKEHYEKIDGFADVIKKAAEKFIPLSGNALRGPLTNALQLGLATAYPPDPLIPGLHNFRPASPEKAGETSEPAPPSTPPKEDQ